MTALDTDILVRFLVEGDAARSRATPAGRRWPPFDRAILREPGFVRP